MFVCMSHFFASTRIEAYWYKKNLFDYFVIAHCLWDGWSSSFSMHFKTTKNTLQGQTIENLHFTPFSYNFQTIEIEFEQKKNTKTVKKP